MPKVPWSKINAIIHTCKESLGHAYEIESKAKQLRSEIRLHLEQIEDIIFRVKNGEE